MRDIVTLAEDYLRANAAESGADAIIRCLLGEIQRVGRSLQDLADACDGVGVKHFDTDSMSPEVSLMQSCTATARAVLKSI